MRILLLSGIMLSVIGITITATYISEPSNFQPETLTVSLVLLSTGVLFICLYCCSVEKCHGRGRNNGSESERELIVEHYGAPYT